MTRIRPRRRCRRWIRSTRLSNEHNGPRKGRRRWIRSSRLSNERNERGDAAGRGAGQGAAREARIGKPAIARVSGPVLSFALDWRPWRSASACRSEHSRNTRSKGSAIARDLRVNQMIRIPQVRVVDEEGAQLGVMPTPQALEMAQERGLDLVEVAPMASPPVVKFLDFGQYKYELTKREKESQAPAALGDLQGSPPLAEDRRRRLRHEGPSGDRVPRGRRSDQGDGPLPRSGADPPGARSEPAREVHRSGSRNTASRTDAAARGQVDAHHGGIDPQAQGARGAAKADRRGAETRTADGRWPAAEPATAADAGHRARQRRRQRSRRPHGRQRRRAEHRHRRSRRPRQRPAAGTAPATGDGNRTGRSDCAGSDQDAAAPGAGNDRRVRPACPRSRATRRPRSASA